MHRSQLKNAPYNPRVIDDWSAQKLRNNIKETGELGGLIWNEKTGNMVGGHQRLAALDALQGNDDYMLTVSAVSLTPKREREQNVFLNNQSAMGTWDEKLLADLIKQPDLNFEGMGFDRIELDDMFAESGLLDSMFSTQPAIVDVVAEAQEARASGDEVRARDRGVQQASEAAAQAHDEQLTTEDGTPVRDPEAYAAFGREREAMREKIAAAAEASDSENYVIIVFKGRKDREDLMQMFGKDPDEKYVDGREFLHKLRASRSVTSE